MRLAILASLIVASCAPANPVGALRFAPEEPVWRVNDRKPQAEPPPAHSFRRTLYKIDTALVHRMTNALELHESKRARDINALDEVPDSTWFTNRIGVRDLTLDELRVGPNVDASPFDHLPWTITGGKVGGRSLGFTFEDALHRKFLLKFDGAAFPELETGTHVILHRILWAIGFNVPQDFLGHVRRPDLQISPKARAKGLDEAALDAALRTVYVRDDGSIRVLASMFVPGKVLGPYAATGVRKGDRNDVIPHELRRSVRGQYPIFAWLSHTDIKEDNTLDAFDDGYVTHYLVDFGKALGAMNITDDEISNGYRSQYDLREAVTNAVTFGLRTEPWEGLQRPPLRGVGLFDAAHYDPEGWAPYLFYPPFSERDRSDTFWGAKLLMRFTPAQLRAIVEEAQLSDPRAVEYLVDTLIARQRATGRAAYRDVVPIDAVTIQDSRLCFTDLVIRDRLQRSPATYSLDVYDRSGKATGVSASVTPDARGRACTAIDLAGDYTIVRVRGRGHTAVVHVATLRDGRVAVVGLRQK